MDSRSPVRPLLAPPLRARRFRIPRLAPLVATVVLLVAAAGCGEDVDVRSALEITDIVTGYYDVGIVDGKNKIVPSIAFRVRNASDRRIDSVQLNAVFRVEGDQEELGSMLVRGIDTKGLGPGELSETFVMRSSLGYTGEQPRSQMLQHKEFRDVQVELFAKHKAKQWVKIGQYRIDRQLLTR